MATYIPRTIEKEIRKAARQFPVVVLTGPRQTGKSTLLKKLFPKHRVADLDDPMTLAQAKKDPLLFLENHTPFLLLDEIQYAPELLPYLKMAVDRNRRRGGQFILTGSQVFPLMEGVSESLAGRAALFELLGFSWEELGGEDASVKNCFRQMIKGFYPDPAAHHVMARNYYGAYLKTYLERDIRQMKSVHDLTLFQRFLELLAARVASLLNLSEIAKECGVSHTTARHWLSLLENTRIVYLLKPYHANVSKRVVKSPKLYLTDTGLLAYLLKYADADALQAGPMAGAFFENMIVIELLKAKFNHNALSELYFFRDSNQNEVDVVIDKGRSKVFVEIKMARTLRLEHAEPLSRIQTKFQDSSAYLVGFAQEPLFIMRNVKLSPWRKVSELVI